MVVKGLIIVWLEAKMMLCDIHEAIVGQLASYSNTQPVVYLQLRLLSFLSPVRRRFVP